jgi:hypothetical protein
MRARDRRTFDDDLPRNVRASGDSGGEGTSNELRGAGEAFLAAADEAINRALSGSSEQFLAQNRQMGGQ